MQTPDGREVMYKYECPECGHIRDTPGLCTMYTNHPIGTIRVVQRRVIFQPAVTPETVGRVTKAMSKYVETSQRYSPHRAPSLVSMAEKAIEAMLT